MPVWRPHEDHSIDIQGSLCLALAQASLRLCLCYSPFLALLHSSLFCPPGVVSAVFTVPTVGVEDISRLLFR